MSNDYLKELPHEESCAIRRNGNRTVGAYLYKCNCRRAEALASVEGLHERIGEIEAEVSALKAQRAAYASEFDGDEGSIHQSIREMKADVDRLRSFIVAMADQYTSEEREAAGNDQGDVSDGFDLAILDARAALDKS